MVSFNPGRLTPGERALGTRWIGRWVDPSTSLNAVQKRNKSLLCPSRESKPNRPAHSLVIILTELPSAAGKRILRPVQALSWLIRKDKKTLLRRSEIREYNKILLLVYLYIHSTVRLAIRRWNLFSAIKIKP
jgi:hypothetical protein